MQPSPPNNAGLQELKGGFGSTHESLQINTQKHGVSPQGHTPVVQPLGRLTVGRQVQAQVDIESPCIKIKMIKRLGV